MPVEETWSPGTRQEKAQFAREAAVNRGDISQETWDVWQELNNGQAVNPENLTQSGKDYYSQLEAAEEKQQPVYQAPSYVQTASGVKHEVQQPQDEQERKSVVVNNDKILSPKERLEQEREESFFDKFFEQPELTPTMSTQGSQNLSDIENEYNKWQKEQQQKAQQALDKKNSDIDRFNAGGGRDVAFTSSDTRDALRPTNFDADFNRRFMNANGSVKHPSEWNIFGLTSQQKTPEPVRNLYDYYFNQEDENAVRNEDAISTKLTNEDEYGKVVRNDLIDDGADPASREAMYMTGEQYLKYRNQLGLPGRDVRYINPDEIYSKQDEMENYGFVPYIVSDDGMNKFNDDASSAFVSNVFNNLADARRRLTDYTLNYDGQTYSGKDFDKNIRLWDQRTSGKKPKLVYNQEEASEYAIPQSVVAYDYDNNKRYVAPNEPIEITTEEDGRIHWRFNDNPDDDWWFENEEDQSNSLKHEPAQDGEYIGAWLNQEPLILDSGQIIRADKAADLWKNYADYADYGPLDIARPSVENPIEEGGWLPWFVDMALSSAPYFHPVSAGAKAGGNMWSNANAMQPGYQDYLNGTYSLISENPTREQQLTSASGSLILPFTERIWGPLGEAMFKVGPTEKILNTLNVPETITQRTVPRLLTGASDEGFEEIAGNIVEDYQSNGLDWYANDKIKVDENGNPMLDFEGNPIVERDSQGRAIKEPTNAGGRLRNFVLDAPLAYLGGATLGGGLGLVNAPSYYNEYKQAQAERNKFGNNASTVPVDVESLMKTSAFNDQERDYYSR